MIFAGDLRKMVRAGWGIEPPHPALTTNLPGAGERHMAVKQSIFRFAQVNSDNQESRTCPLCGVTVPLSRKNRVYCSRACASRSHAAVRNSAGASNPNWKGGEVALPCCFCGKEFSVRPARKDKAKYCSLSCWSRDQHAKGVWKAPRQRAKRPPKQPNVIISCEWCRTEFEVPYLRRRVKFCAKTCEFAWRRSWMRNRGNPNWMGGISHLPYPHDWPRISRKAMKRDLRKCWNPECEKTCVHLTVHHIDYNKSNCDPANLITLCSACNSKANYRRETWLSFYTKIQEQRGIYPLAPGIPSPWIGERPGRKGTAHPMARLSDADVREIRRLRQDGMTGRSIAKRFGISECSVCNICKRKSWSHVV